MKLKKKQRPMSIAEWAKSIGADVAVAEMDEEQKERIIAKHDDDMEEGFRAVSAAYDAYICAHIAHILEKKR